MKLYSDFHDYYDTAVGFGRDENVHYNRYRKEVSVVLEAKAEIPSFGYHVKVDKLPQLLGFCGQVFPLVKIKERDENNRLVFCHYAFTYEDLFNQLLERKEIREEISQKLWWQRIKQTDKEIRKTLTKDLLKARAKQFFADWSKQDDSLFLEHKVPLWLLESGYYSQTIILNPKLEMLNFQRIKDSQTAFQEISMYLSNILVEQKETAEIADKYRLEQHGFDAKISFRKEGKI